MLEAKKSRWFEKIFALYNRNLFKRRFQAIKIQGLENLDRTPLLIYCNHSSWWDGLVAFEISRRAKLDSFVMMEEKQLKNLFLFRKIGAFSVVREKPRKAVKSISYAANMLREKSDRAVWLFPQGEILPNDLRPLRFYNGISRIAEKVGECYLVPLAMKYEFMGDYKPEVLVKIGHAELNEKVSAKELTLKLAEKLTSQLDQLRLDIINRRLEDYENIL